tara:strand:+ start:153 stop:452 length:300 start_codon:yes stop_codon:yes gene_type:complete
MSYSRWINSSWYTFWSGSASSRSEEQFACLADLDGDHQFHWPYNLVKDFIKNRSRLETIIQQVKATDDEISELLEYMKEFVADVDLKYDKEIIKLRGGQ